MSPEIHASNLAAARVVCAARGWPQVETIVSGAIAQAKRESAEMRGRMR